MSTVNNPHRTARSVSMDKPGLRFVLLWITMTLGQTHAYPHADVSEHRTTADTENQRCVFHNRSGSVHLQSNDIMASNDGLWIVQSTDANWITIQFEGWFNEEVERFIILVYTQAPVSAHCPDFVYDSREKKGFITLKTNKIWIQTSRADAALYVNCTSFDNDTARDDHITSQTGVSSTQSTLTQNNADCSLNRQRRNDTVVSISYVSFANTSIIPSCNVNSFQIPANGRVVSKESSNTLGSEIQIECAAGFLFRGASRTSTCAVLNGELAWMGGENSSCVPVCFSEPKVENAHANVFYIQNEEDALGYFYTIPNNTAGFSNTLDRPMQYNDNTRQGDHSRRIRHVVYQCNEPYVLVGNNNLECSQNERSVWAWSSGPPMCTIPDCSTVIRLDQPSGALVNPSYPSNHLHRGQASCRWDLNSPTGSTFEFSFLYLDLPPIDDVGLDVMDAGASRPGQRRHFSGVSTPENFTSDSSRVIVTYQGPESVVRDHRGFYLQFTSREPQIQIQIEQLFDEPGSQDVSADVVLTPAQGSARDATLQANRTGPSASSPPDNPRPTDPSSPRLKTTAHSKADDSGDTWKIAVGVVLPFLVLIVVLVSVYVIYRKKFPVRMIIGREFSKFNNPSYSSSRTNATLVREDAEDYFANRQSATEGSADFNPIHPNIHYDNRGFVHDEEDEEEAERKFMEKKAWLFKKPSSELDTKSNGETSSGRGKNNESDENSLNTVDGEVRRQGSKTSTDTDISELLGEQQVTPKPKPRGKKRGGSESSESGSTVEGSNSADTDKAKLQLSGKSSSLDIMNSSESSSLDQANGTSSTVRAARVIFNQPTFEEVVADIRARSRSMSVENTKIVLRPRSQSVDLLKSARRTSIDDHAATSHSPTSPLTIATDKDRIPKVTANIVDVQIRIQTGSISSSTSTAVTDDSITDRKVSEVDGEEEKLRSLSLLSMNSNPHLVTDLDESLDAESEALRTYGAWDRAPDANTDEIKQLRFEEIKEEDAEVDPVVGSDISEKALSSPDGEDRELVSQNPHEEVEKEDSGFKDACILVTIPENHVKQRNNGNVNHRENADGQLGDVRENEIPAHSAECSTYTSSDQKDMAHADLTDTETRTNVGDSSQTFVTSATVILDSDKNEIDRLQRECYVSEEKRNLDEGRTVALEREVLYQAQGLANDEERVRFQTKETTEKDDDALVSTSGVKQSLNSPASSDESTSDENKSEKDVPSEDAMKAKKRLRFEIPAKTQSPGSDDTTSGSNSDSDGSSDKHTSYDFGASVASAPENATRQKEGDIADLSSFPGNSGRKNIKAPAQFVEHSDSDSSGIEDTNDDEEDDDSDDDEMGDQDSDGSISENEDKESRDPDRSSSHETESKLRVIQSASSPRQSVSNHELSPLPPEPVPHNLPQPALGIATDSFLEEPKLAPQERRKLMVHEVQLSDTSSNASSSPPRGNISSLNSTEEENFNVDIQFRPDGKKKLLSAVPTTGGRFSRSGSSESEGEEFTDDDISEAVRIVTGNNNDDNDDKSDDKVDTFASVGDRETVNSASYQEGSDNADQVSAPINTYRFRWEESDDEDIDV